MARTGAFIHSTLAKVKSIKKKKENIKKPTPRQNMMSGAVDEI